MDLMDCDGEKACEPGVGFITRLFNGLKNSITRLSLAKRSTPPVESVKAGPGARLAATIDPLLDPINEGAKAVGQAPKAGQISQSRMSAIEGAHGDRSQQLNKLRSVAKAIGAPESGKEVWFSKDQVVVPVSPGYASPAPQTQRRNQRMTEARLTSTRLQALAEALEPKREE